MTADKSDFRVRYWKSILLVDWVAASAYFLFERWQAIHWFALGDTDDNMRIMQVRALMHGQDWYDLRQYRLDPPHGANIHWSHFVDLPIVAIILLTKPFFGALVAERIAIESYRDMIAFVGSDDPTTRRLLEEILAKEEEHAEDLVSLLK